MTAPNRFFVFRCHACGTVHHIVRALALTCPACGSRPGEQCKDLRAKQRYRVTVHDERQELIRVLDEATPSFPDDEDDYEADPPGDPGAGSPAVDTASS